MKRFQFGGFFGGVMLGVALACGDTPTTHPNTAVIPSLAEGFRKHHEQNVEIAKKGDIDVLFMGDSITDWWQWDGPKWPKPTPEQAATRPALRASLVPGAYDGKEVFQKYFGQMKVANFGIAGDTTQGVLYRLQHGEGQGFNPKAIMLMIGTNNTGRNSAEEIADGVKADVEELRKDFPQAKILLLGIFPRNNPPEAIEKIKQINPIIAKLADGEHVTYMDLTDKFLGPDGKVPEDVMSDGLHPTSKGYEIWAQAVVGPLKKMLGTE